MRSAAVPKPAENLHSDDTTPHNATQREYLSVKLDDPSFPAPIYASLVEAEDGESYNLIWSRRNGD